MGDESVRWCWVEPKSPGKRLYKEEKLKKIEAKTRVLFTSQSTRTRKRDLGQILLDQLSRKSRKTQS